MRETVRVSRGKDRRSDPTRWIVHGERLIDDTRRLRLSVAQVELPDGARFEQYVLRMPKAAMTVVLDDAGKRVLMIWRHRFVPDHWTWELPGGYVDPDEDPAAAAAREVEEETGKSADANEAAHVEWITLDSVRDRITQGEIIGAGTQIGLLHVLAFHAGQAR